MQHVLKQEGMLLVLPRKKLLIPSRARAHLRCMTWRCITSAASQALSAPPPCCAHMLPRHALAPTRSTEQAGAAYGVQYAAYGMRRAAHASAETGVKVPAGGCSAGRCCRLLPASKLLLPCLQHQHWQKTAAQQVRRRRLRPLLLRLRLLLLGVPRGQTLAAGGAVLGRHAASKAPASPARTLPLCQVGQVSSRSCCLATCCTATCSDMISHAAT